MLVQEGSDANDLVRFSAEVANQHGIRRFGVRRPKSDGPGFWIKEQDERIRRAEADSGHKVHIDLAMRGSKPYKKSG